MSHRHSRYRHVGFLLLRVPAHRRRARTAACGAQVHDDRRGAGAPRALVACDLSVRDRARDARAGHRGPAVPRLRLRRAPLPARRHDRDGTRPHGLLDRHLQRRARRTGDGVDLSVRFRRATRTIPARDGALRQDRFVRADRTGGRFGGLGWVADDGAPRRGHLDPQRPKEVDRQCDLRGPDRHLGQGCRRWAGERLCGAELFAGVHRREADAQDRAANRAERPDHAGQRPRRRVRPTAAGQLVQRHRGGAAGDPRRGGVDGGRLRDGGL